MSRLVRPSHHARQFEDALPIGRPSRRYRFAYRTHEVSHIQAFWQQAQTPVPTRA